MSAVPISKPYIESQPRPQLRVEVGTGPSLARQIVGSLIAFSLVMLLTVGVSSLAGQVMVEQARRDGIRANQRLHSAISAQATLAKQIEVLSNSRDLEQWALRNGFVAPESQVGTSLKNVVVASR